MLNLIILLKFLAIIPLSAGILKYFEQFNEFFSKFSQVVFNLLESELNWVKSNKWNLLIYNNKLGTTEFCDNKFSLHTFEDTGKFC